MSSSDATLIIGGSGYLGGLITGCLLAHEERRLILPVRAHHTRQSVLEPILIELAAEGIALAPDALQRVEVLPLPDGPDLDSLEPTLRRLGVTEIIHSAACMSFTDSEQLEAVNVGLTEALVRLGCRLGVRRFIYVSTAFSCGFEDSIIREELHSEPRKDINDYTRTKRRAEQLVAESGLPYLILRPSLVIGDSRDGRYQGKPFGLYRVWNAADRLLGDRYHETLHLVAPSTPCPLVHQDLFKEVFVRAYRQGYRQGYRQPPNESILHVVSEHEKLPTLREVLHLGLQAYLHPRKLYYYETLADFPFDDADVPREQRQLAELMADHAVVMSRRFHFARTELDRLMLGSSLPELTLESVARCLHVSHGSSSRADYFLKHLDENPSAKMEIIAI